MAWNGQPIDRYQTDIVAFCFLWKKKTQETVSIGKFLQEMKKNWILRLSYRFHSVWNSSFWHVPLSTLIYAEVFCMMCIYSKIGRYHLCSPSSIDYYLNFDQEISLPYCCSLNRLHRCHCLRVLTISQLGLINSIIEFQIEMCDYKHGHTHTKNHENQLPFRLPLNHRLLSNQNDAFHKIISKTFKHSSYKICLMWWRLPLYIIPCDEMKWQHRTVMLTQMNIDFPQTVGKTISNHFEL